MFENTFIMLIGPPASGKSTFVEKWFKSDPISPDRIRYQLTGDESDQTQNAKVWETVRYQIERLAQHCYGPAQVVLDATSAKRKDRRSIIAHAKECGYEKVVGIWLRTDVEECFARNAKRDRVVPEDVILKMWTQLIDNPPSVEDGFDLVLEVR